LNSLSIFILYTLRHRKCKLTGTPIARRPLDRLPNVRYDPSLKQQTVSIIQGGTNEIPTNKLSRERGLNLRAIARGANPNKEIAPKAALGLQADGLKSDEAAPKKISKADCEPSMSSV
jgi:hypothetical protein